MVLTKQRRRFQSSRVKLPFVKMSASWFLVSTYLIWILVSKSILSNSQSSATLWVRDTCLIVGLLPCIITSRCAVRSVATVVLTHTPRTTTEPSSCKHVRTRRPPTQNLLLLAGASSWFWQLRWCEEALQTMQQLAHARAREAPSPMQFPLALMWERRWTRMLAVCSAVSFAASLVEPARNTTWCGTGW